MSEDARLPPASRHLAASVASKCYYHLEDYSQALRLALAAGPYFDVTARTQYVETIVGEYLDVPSVAGNGSSWGSPLRPR